MPVKVTVFFRNNDYFNGSLFSSAQEMDTNLSVIQNFIKRNKVTFFFGRFSALFVPFFLYTY